MEQFTYNTVTPEVIDKVLNLVAIIHLPEENVHGIERTSNREVQRRVRDLLITPIQSKEA